MISPMMGNHGSDFDMSSASLPGQGMAVRVRMAVISPFILIL